MKSIKLLPLILLAVLIGCNDMDREEEKEEMAEEVRDPAEANQEWIAAWNQNDPDKLQSMTSNDAVLYMQGSRHTADSITSWFRNNAPNMKDLKTTAQIQNYNDSIAYEAGTYSHGIKQDSLNSVFEGTYTIIWERASDDWEIKLMNITQKQMDTTATEMEEE